jgi:hypothetical protein
MRIRPWRRFTDVTTPTRTLLGLLFPSWTFFDAVRATPALEIRPFPTAGMAGDWRPAVTPPRRRWWHLVFNPAGTHTLAAQTLVEAWCRELLDAEQPPSPESQSFPLVLALAKAAVAAEGAAALPSPHGWQLRLVLRHPEDGRREVLHETGRLPFPLTGRSA